MGGAMPLIYSLLGDLYPADQRNGGKYPRIQCLFLKIIFFPLIPMRYFYFYDGKTAIALIGMASGIGIGVGQGVAGYLGPSFGWRLPFLVVSLPALFMAFCILIFVKEPERGMRERAVVSLVDTDDEGSEISIEVDTRKDAKNSTMVEQHPPPDEINATPHSMPSSKLHQRNLQNPNPVPHVDTELDFDHDSVEDSFPKYFSCVSHYATKICLGCTKSLSSASTLLRTKTFLLLVIQGIPGCIPWSIVNVYLTDFLSTEKGMTIEVCEFSQILHDAHYIFFHVNMLILFYSFHEKFATTTNLVFGAGVFLGMFVSGLLGNYLYAKSPRYPSLLAGSSAILGCIPFYVLLNYVTFQTSLSLVLFISITAGVGTGVAGPIVKATLLNVMTPNQRSQGFAIFNTFNDLGVGLGPFFTALLIEAFHGNRAKAFNLGVSQWVFCGIFNLCVFWTVAEDEEMVQQLIVDEFRISDEDSSPQIC